MIIDIIVLVVLLASALIAFIRGFIRESLTIAGVVGGMAAAYFGSPLLQPYMRSWIGVKEVLEEGEEPAKLLGMFPYGMVADALSYGIIFIVVVIALSIVSHILAESAKSLGLGALDRTLGVLFGLARGAIILAVLYAPFHYFMGKEDKEAWFGTSKTHVYLETTTAALSGLIPDDTMNQLEKDAQKISSTIGDPREKLDQAQALKKKYDVLKGELPPEALKKAKETGYDNEFRKVMDEKFSEESQEGTDGPEEYGEE